MGREDIFQATTANETLHKDRNDNGDRVVNLATSNNLVLNGRMFQYRYIPKYPWTSPDGKAHNQIDHILIDKR
jgi:hypothetical protein